MPRFPGTKLRLSHYSISFDSHVKSMRCGLYLQIGKLRVREVICWRPQSRYAAQSHPLHTSYHGPVAEKKEHLNQKTIFWSQRWHNCWFQAEVGAVHRCVSCWPIIHQPQEIAWPPGLRFAGSQALDFSSHIPFSWDHHRSSAPLLLKSSILTLASSH